MVRAFEIDCVSPGIVLFTCFGSVISWAVQFLCIVWYVHSHLFITKGKLSADYTWRGPAHVQAAYWCVDPSRYVDIFDRKREQFQAARAAIHFDSGRVSFRHGFPCRPCLAHCLSKDAVELSG